MCDMRLVILWPRATIDVRYASCDFMAKIYNSTFFWPRVTKAHIVHGLNVREHCGEQKSRTCAHSPSCTTRPGQARSHRVYCTRALVQSTTDRHIIVLSSSCEFDREIINLSSSSHVYAMFQKTFSKPFSMAVSARFGLQIVEKGFENVF